MDDVERLSKLLDLCSTRGVELTRARVGSVEVHFSPARPASSSLAARDPDEEKAEEFYSMYGASEGDFPGFDAEEFQALQRAVG